MKANDAEAPSLQTVSTSKGSAMEAKESAVVFELSSRRGANVRPREVSRATYTVPEVAELLGLSRATTYVLLRQGEIPARRIGCRWIIARRRFDAWLDGVATDLGVAN